MLFIYLGDSDKKRKIGVRKQKKHEVWSEFNYSLKLTLNESTDPVLDF